MGPDEKSEQTIEQRGELVLPDLVALSNLMRAKAANALIMVYFIDNDC